MGLKVNIPLRPKTVIMHDTYVCGRPVTISLLNVLMKKTKIQTSFLIFREKQEDYFKDNCTEESNHAFNIIELCSSS